MNWPSVSHQASWISECGQELVHPHSDHECISTFYTLLSRSFLEVFVKWQQDFHLSSSIWQWCNVSVINHSLSMHNLKDDHIYNSRTFLPFLHPNLDLNNSKNNQVPELSVDMPREKDLPTPRFVCPNTSNQSELVKIIPESMDTEFQWLIFISWSFSCW